MKQLSFIGGFLLTACMGGTLPPPTPTLAGSSGTPLFPLEVEVAEPVLAILDSVSLPEGICSKMLPDDRAPLIEAYNNTLPEAYAALITSTRISILSEEGIDRVFQAATRQSGWLVAGYPYTTIGTDARLVAWGGAYCRQVSHDYGYIYVRVFESDGRNDLIGYTGSLLNVIPIEDGWVVRTSLSTAGSMIPNEVWHIHQMSDGTWGREVLSEGATQIQAVDVVGDALAFDFFTPNSHLPCEFTDEALAFIDHANLKGRRIFKREGDVYKLLLDTSTPTVMVKKHPTDPNKFTLDNWQDYCK